MGVLGFGLGMDNSTSPPSFMSPPSCSRADARTCLVTSMVALSRICRASAAVALGRTVAAWGFTAGSDNEEDEKDGTFLLLLILEEVVVVWFVAE